jgi:hypothetical protein
MFRLAQRFRTDWTFEGFVHCDLGRAAGVFEALRPVAESHHLQHILAKVAIWHNGRSVISPGYFYPCNGYNSAIYKTPSVRFANAIADVAAARWLGYSLRETVVRARLAEWVDSVRCVSALCGRQNVLQKLLQSLQA